VIVSQEDEGEVTSERAYETGLEVGMTVRIIREPYFGLLGKVVSLPSELKEIETESKVRILEVELEDGERITLPRANVEIFEA
jgi:transcription antitermination factor NusG